MLDGLLKLQEAFVRLHQDAMRVYQENGALTQRLLNKEAELQAVYRRSAELEARLPGVLPPRLAPRPAEVVLCSGRLNKLSFTFLPQPTMGRAGPRCCTSVAMDVV